MGSSLCLLTAQEFLLLPPPLPLLSPLLPQHLLRLPQQVSLPELCLLLPAGATVLCPVLQFSRFLGGGGETNVRSKLYVHMSQLC